jgi:NAD(P)-dependent dehydrogenase (short-subunit alcohol dehydrogenase family)
MKIEGHSAIVTGGGSGLGEAVARELARLGAKVAVLDVNGDNAGRVAAAIGGVGFAADITDSASLVTALDAAEAAQGTARIVMNIAGIGSARRVISKDGTPAPLEDFERVVRINLVGTYNVVRLTAARIAKLALLDDGERGVMLMTASVAAFEGQVGQEAYSASKGGVVAMTLPLARDLAQHAIRVCTMRAGPVRDAADAAVAGRCAAVAGGVDTVPQTPRPARGIRGARRAHRQQRPPQWRSDPHRRRAAHGAALTISTILFY